MQVGFIGLGIMGASMASNLQKAGFKLVVHDLRRQNASAHLEAGAQVGGDAQGGRRGLRGGVHVAAGTGRVRGGGARQGRARSRA